MNVVPPGFASLLERLRAHESLRGDRSARFHVLRHIEGPFSDVLRVRISTADRRFIVFVKRFKQRAPCPYEPLIELEAFVQTEFDSLTDVYERMRAKGLCAARPLALFADEATIVTEEAEGIPLARLLRRTTWRLARASPIRDYMARVGEWLRIYQSAAQPQAHVSLADQRVYLDQRLRYLSGRVLSSTERRWALSLFDGLADEIGTASPSVAVHGDLCPANIIVAPNGVTVLDFSMAASGSPFHDLAHLYLHLEFLKRNRLSAGDTVDQFQSALMRDFDPELRPSDPAFLMMLLRHVVCHVTQVADSGPHGTVRAKRRWRECLAIPLFSQRPSPVPSWRIASPV